MSDVFSIAMYQGLEIILDNDNEPWMTQRQIAQMLGVNINSISKAIKRAFDEGEYEDPDSVCVILSHTADDGKTYQVQYYNADVILMVGYRAHRSATAREFRRWATNLWRMGWQQRVTHLEDQLYNAELRAHFAEKDLESRWEQELTVRYPEEF